ncbi:MAG: aminotransferase class III-fold pyridoxal phosphate-dependent enzyme [Candidatus Omnitrophica bacterium]|nr:aminotransferase class III-fold pyridoxal phosphate-dependent enzyme [Candidatus Omnitrophota bacterium]
MAAMTYSYYPPDVLPQGFRVIRGANDLLFTEDGKQYIDLLSGSGTVFLGHANPAITRTIKEQLDTLWSTGAVPTCIASEAWTAVEAFLPTSHRLAVLYSTGMEAVEFAVRVARQVTGRKGLIGFNGCMHGKSMAAARLGWPNQLATLPDFHSLPYLPEEQEEVILEHARDLLATGSIAGVFLEPLLGSRGGHIPSRRFVEQLSSLCGEHGSLLVLDEIFTGFHRTGPVFLHHELGVTPDILLVGKAMGSGFPVSGVVLDRRYPIQGSMLPGSTFAGNALAAAAVVATLREMRTRDVAGTVRAIEQTVLRSLNDLGELGIALRGKGALWVLELPPGLSLSNIVARILRNGVVVSTTANFIRLLPAATIPQAHLTRACEVIAQACRAGSGAAAQAGSV